MKWPFKIQTDVFFYQNELYQVFLKTSSMQNGDDSQFAQVTLHNNFISKKNSQAIISHWTNQMAAVKAELYPKGEVLL